MKNVADYITRNDRRRNGYPPVNKANLTSGVVVCLLTGNKFHASCYRMGISSQPTGGVLPTPPEDKNSFPLAKRDGCFYVFLYVTMAGSSVAGLPVKNSSPRNGELFYSQSLRLETARISQSVPGGKNVSNAGKNPSMLHCLTMNHPQSGIGNDAGITKFPGDTRPVMYPKSEQRIKKSIPAGKKSDFMAVIPLNTPMNDDTPTKARPVLLPLSRGGHLKMDFNSLFNTTSTDNHGGYAHGRN